MKQETIKILNTKHKCLPLTYTTNKTIHHESPKYNLNLPLSIKTQKLPPINMHKYSPFLWRIAKGQSRLIIKSLRRGRMLNTHQIRIKSLKLNKHIHQNLSMRHLNGHESLQHTPNGSISGWRRQMINNDGGIDKLLNRWITRWRRPRCITCGRLNSRVFGASFHLSRSLPKKGGTYEGNDMNRLGCRKIL